MNKENFKQIRKKCPWFFNHGEPKCMAVANRYCCKKNCAPLFWVWVMLEKLEEQLEEQL